MNRRNFLGMLVGGVATAAAVRTWPFRVYSFPPEPIWTAVDWGFVPAQYLTFSRESEGETAYRVIRRNMTMFDVANARINAYLVSVS